MKINYAPTEANFIYIHVEDKTAFPIYTSFLKKGVIVRPMGDNAIRVTIGLPKENRRLVEALKIIVKEMRL